ncbi:uncharacterized protein LOC117330120 [Pecten maximus]|uniref:uncharacterized protein LOC117330120 n=1 Tax=Pecten maximus TaxID=6579 RepID=UPI0014580B8D|nr:uncharacterized protein LOC117330120 [Pecten maximus]
MTVTTYKMLTLSISVLVGLFLLVGDVEGGECCKAHDGIFTIATNKEMWCSDYCCFKLSNYYCCDDISFQADSWDREEICGDYFSQNVWAPILISIACLASLIVIMNKMVRANVYEIN